jgi:hypothetical protein
LCGVLATAILTVGLGGIWGCSGAPPGTDEPIGKPLSQEEIKEGQKKVMDGMKGYKGAPGAPFKKG